MAVEARHCVLEELRHERAALEAQDARVIWSRNLGRTPATAYLCRFKVVNFARLFVEHIAFTLRRLATEARALARRGLSMSRCGSIVRAHLGPLTLKCTASIHLCATLCVFSNTALAQQGQQRSVSGRPLNLQRGEGGGASETGAARRRRHLQSLASLSPLVCSADLRGAVDPERAGGAVQPTSWDHGHGSAVAPSVPKTQASAATPRTERETQGERTS